MLLCAIVRGLLLGAVAAQSTPAPPSTSTPPSTTLSVAPAAYREYTTNVTHDSPLLAYTGEWAVAGTTQCPGHLAASAGASVQLSWVGRGLSFVGGVAAGTSLTFTVDDQPAQPYGTGAAGVITGTVGLEYAHHTATLTLTNGVICLSSVALTVLQQTSSDTDQIETFMAVPGAKSRRKRFRFRFPHLVRRQASGNAVTVPANTTLLQIYGTPASGGDTTLTLSPAPPLGAPATMTIPASTAAAAPGAAPLLYMAPLDPSVTYAMTIDSPAPPAGAQGQPWQIDFHKGAKVDGDPPAAGVTVPVLGAAPAGAGDTTNPAPAADPGAAAAGGAAAGAGAATGAGADGAVGGATGAGADAEPKPAPAADPDAAKDGAAATGGADATDAPAAPAATGGKTNAAPAALTSKTSKDGKDDKDKDGDKSKDSANSGSGHSPNKAGIIAGSVLGALAGLILLAIIFWWMLRRGTRRSPRGRQRASSVWGPRSPMWSSKKQYFTDIPDAPPVPDIPSMYQPNMAGAGAVGGMGAGPGMGMGMGAGAGVIRGLGPRGSGGSSIEELHSNESHGQRGNGGNEPFEADSRYPESVSPTPADHPFNNVVRKPVNPFETPFDDPADAPMAASGVNPHPHNSGLRVLPPPIIPPVPVLSPMMQGRRTPSVPNSPMSPVPPPRASVRNSRSQPGSRREPRRSQLVVTNRTPPATPPPHAPITSFPGASVPPTPPPMHPPPPPPVSGPIRSTTPLKLHNRSRSRKLPAGKFKSGTSSISPGHANANRVRSQRKTALQSLYDLYGGDEEYVESEYSQDDRRDTRAHLHDSAWWSRPSSTNTEFVSNLIDARTRGSVAPALRQVARNASQRRLV